MHQRRSLSLPLRAVVLPLHIVLLLLTLAVVGSPLVAESHQLDLEPDNCQIAFSLQATGHDVHGLFHLQGGRLVFDPEKSTASGDIEIRVLGSETGNKKRDRTMHAKVLESEAHPLIRFRPERIEGDLRLEGSSDFTLVGTVTLLGTDHPLSLPTHAEIAGDQVRATATFPVPYVEWGLHNPSAMVLRVAKVVEVTVTLAGTLSAATESPAPSGGH
jgi:hypothetical protein